jgi:hypothetical protein
VATVLVLASLTAGAAIAALIIDTGAQGSGTAHVQNSSTVNAITITDDGSNPARTVGGVTGQQYTFHNNDPGAAHTITALTGTVSTPSDPSCASFVSFNASGGVGLNVPASGSLRLSRVASSSAYALFQPASHTLSARQLALLLRGLDVFGAPASYCALIEPTAEVLTPLDEHTSPNRTGGNMRRAKRISRVRRLPDLAERVLGEVLSTYQRSETGLRDPSEDGEPRSKSSASCPPEDPRRAITQN